MDTGLTTLRRPLTGRVTVLTPTELPLLSEHLLRLDPESRRQRFNGVIGEGFIERYHSQYITDDTVVIGYIDGGKMRGAAELHPPDQKGSTPEIAFSVEKNFRSQGIGSILFEKVIQEARKRNYLSLAMSTDRNNDGMKSLARKFGVYIEYRKGEARGILRLKSSVSTGDERINELRPTAA